MPKYVGIVWMAVCGMALAAAMISKYYLASTGIILLLAATIFLYARKPRTARSSTYYSRSWPGMVLALGVAAAIALPYGGWNLFEAWSSARWPQVQGTILSSKVVRNNGSHTHDYSPDIIYSYEVAGKRYTNGRVGFPRPVFDDQSAARAEATRYPVGKPVPIFYNTGNPENAVLEPGLTADTWFAPLMGLAALSVVLVLIHRNRSKQEW